MQNHCSGAKLCARQKVDRDDGDLGVEKMGNSQGAEFRPVLRPATAKLVARLLAPLLDPGLVTADEYRTITSTLNHLAWHGSPLPDVPRKLIRPQEAAELLGISYSGFREIESKLPIRRRVIGKSVRYYLPEIVLLMESEALVKGEIKSAPDSL